MNIVTATSAYTYIKIKTNININSQIKQSKKALIYKTSKHTHIIANHK